MTSIPASRNARAMIFAPRSCPSRPGLATTTRILRWVEVSAMGAAMLPPPRCRSPHLDVEDHLRRVHVADEAVGPLLAERVPVPRAMPDDRVAERLRAAGGVDVVGGVADELERHLRALGHHDPVLVAVVADEVVVADLDGPPAGQGGGREDAGEGGDQHGDEEL